MRLSVVVVAVGLLDEEKQREVTLGCHHWVWLRAVPRQCTGLWLTKNLHHEGHVGTTPAAS